MKHIFLTGFMGTGKTTISRQLKEDLQMEAVDLDREIERSEQMSIPDIFEKKGEEYFRQRETAFLRGLKEKQGMIVSCGGGVPLRAENVRAMKACGMVILLKAKPETIYERVKNSHNRPLLENHKTTAYIRELLEKRMPFYTEAADVQIVTDGKTTLQISKEIEKILDSSNAV